jgi:hypothetical protein
LFQAKGLDLLVEGTEVEVFDHTHDESIAAAPFGDRRAAGFTEKWLPVF